MKLQHKVTYPKIIILGLIVLGFDLLLEYAIVNIRQTTHLFDDYLVSGIIIQMCMMLFGILLYVLFIHKRFFTNLFPKEKSAETKKYILKFIIVFPILLILIYTLVFIMDPFTWSMLKETIIPTNPPLWKIIVFEAIFPGIGEETLYRGFLLSLLAYPLFFLNKTITKKRFIVSLLVASVVFTIAHFGYGFSPFQITYDSYQLFTAFFVGGVEGYVFLKTKSLLGPIFIHNISNIMLTAVPILIGLIF